ncbi:MAG: alpha,alpha-trehalase [Planctomycetes bacterium]|nr:alpha,alpha-trehalase [Planctomycetota bacterium]
MWVATVLLIVASAAPAGAAEQGMYFAKKAYEPAPLPVFEKARDELPSPIYDADPDAVRCYWKTWEIAFRNFHAPAPGSGYVSNFIDAAFNQNIFLWDTCFMTVFCNYGHPLVPGIASLDNFYAKQHETGEICREIDRKTGKDFAPWVNAEGGSLISRWGYGAADAKPPVEIEYRGREAPSPPPHLTLDALNHPILAFAEVESFHITGDRARLAAVWEPLVRYYRSLQTYIRQGNGLYMTDWASMDNSARNPYLARGGTAIDTSSEMVLFARNLAEIAKVLGKADAAEAFAREADSLSETIDEKMWDEGERFYFDLTLDEKRAPVKSVAAFWTLIARVAPPERAKALAAALEDPRLFKTKHRVPTLAASEPGFDGQNGSYWRGSVWAPTTMMVVRGLEANGFRDLAAEIALNHFENALAVFKETGTVWENYAPQRIAPGKPARPDFVGWSGIAPIALFIEYAIGIRADAATETIDWTIRSPKRVGIERFRFAGKTLSLICEAPDATGTRVVKGTTDGAFRLRITRGKDRAEVAVSKGTFEIRL